MYLFLYIGLFVALLVLPSILILVNYKSKIKCYILIICIPLIFSIMFTCLACIDINSAGAELKQFRTDSANIINEYEKYLEDWSNCINNHPATEINGYSYQCPEDHSNSKQLDYTISIYENNIEFRFKIGSYEYNGDYSIYASAFWNLKDKGGSLFEKSKENFESLKSKIYRVNILNINYCSLGDNDYNYYYSGVHFFSDMESCIAILVLSLVTLCISFTSMGLRISYVTKKKDEPNAEIILETENDNVVQEVKEPTWEEISQEDKKIYLDNAIKEMYEKQLANDTQLTRQQKAIKRDSIANNEFYLEDLTDEEKIEIEKVAKEKYDSKETLDISKKQIVPTNKKFIRAGIQWLIIGMIIATKSSNMSKQTIGVRNGRMEINDNSEKGSFIMRPCGKCTGVSGEKPIDFVVGLNPLKKKFSCCAGFHGFSFKRDDIIEYRQISSTSKSERYELLHINGKKISLSLTPVGADLLNAVLGNEKLKG